MNEIPRKFNLVESVTVSEAIDPKIIDWISDLKRRANDHEDFDVTMDFSDAIADFAKELAGKYEKEDIGQVPLYHHLINSGIATGMTYEKPITPQTRSAIERSIIEFVEEKLIPLVETPNPAV